MNTVVRELPRGYPRLASGLALSDEFVLCCLECSRDFESSSQISGQNAGENYVIRTLIPLSRYGLMQVTHYPARGRYVDRNCAVSTLKWARDASLLNFRCIVNAFLPADTGALYHLRYT